MGTLVCADHLGRQLCAAGRLDEAEQLLRRAVTGLEEERLRSEAERFDHRRWWVPSIARR